MKIGFIGLGNMGAAMASNLIKAGHELTVYNRTREKARPLVEQGAHLAGEISDASRGEVVITMLADDQAIETVGIDKNGILASLPEDAIHISCSTISLQLAEKLTTEHASRGQHFISAPVFGRPEAAASGKLFITVAGESAVIERCMPLFNAMGQRTFRFGEKPALANLVKLSGNFLIASVIESLAEAMALAGKGGLDQHQYLEFLTSTLFNAPVYKTYGAIIADKKFVPAGFVAPLGLKDVRLALAAGEQLRVPLPFASVVRDRLLTLIARHCDSIDWSAVARIAAEDSGQAK